MLLVEVLWMLLLLFPAEAEIAMLATAAAAASGQGLALPLFVLLGIWKVKNDNNYVEKTVLRN